jgi:hypothetical protein
VPAILPGRGKPKKIATTAQAFEFVNPDQSTLGDIGGGAPDRTAILHHNFAFAERLQGYFMAERDVVHTRERQGSRARRLDG